MTLPPHHCTVQLSEVVLQLRDDLSISVRQFGSEPVYILEDEVNSRFYRIGLAEYTFVSLLDGQRTFADALGRTASIMKEQALSESKAAGLCSWLVECGLASTAESRNSARLFQKAERTQHKRTRGRLNPLFIKIPLFNPDPLMQWAAVGLGWLFSWPMFIAWMVLVGSGMMCVAMHWTEATSMSFDIVSRFNWLWLIGTWALLKVTHELAHGVTSRHYGAPVREAGVLTILFIPLPYVDVTSSWRIESPRHRILIAAMGMIVELGIAAIAAIVWSQTRAGMLHQHAFNTMFTASVLTVLFNANPLMRFDGYYILTDLLGMPNLASHGQQRLRALGRRWFLGIPSSTPTWPEGRTWLVTLYGIAALLWRILICVSITLAAGTLYYGAGIVLAAIAIGIWVVVPTIALLKFLIFGSRTEHPNRQRFAVTTGSVAIVVGLILFLPWYQQIKAPAVVDYHPILQVRAGVSGFVKDIHVSSGQFVQPGQKLVTLENQDLNAKVRETEIQLQQSIQRARILHKQNEIAAWQIEQKNSQTLKDQRQQLTQRAKKLHIVAPAKGVVLDFDLESMLGSHVSAGQLVTSIGSGNEKRLLALVNENQIDHYTKHIDKSVDVHIWGTGRNYTTGRLHPAEPRASTKIQHPALASIAGGPLDVQMVTDASDSKHNETTYVFAQPLFLAPIDVKPEILSQYDAGRSGFIRFRTYNGTVGGTAKRALLRWWQHYQELRETTPVR